MPKLLGRIAIGLGLALVLIQLVPYGRNHTNPPVRIEPVWDRPETRALAKRACFDCHSNETRYPWYSNIAPVSWLTERDTLEGRGKLNFSEWDHPQKDAKEASEEVEKGEMPLWFYLPLHPEANLTDAEKTLLVGGLRATIGGGAGDVTKSNSR
jgi:hypothetical protein